MKKNKKNMKKLTKQGRPLPKVKTDKDIDDLLKNDLSEYINSRNFKPAHFEFMPKTEQINVRVSEPLLSEFKIKANKLGIGYQKYLRFLMEQSVL
jgi:predicted DNA binding CopG/RHH family protein